MADIGTALVSGGAGLIGAAIGAISAQVAAWNTREADRKKKCVDRVLAAMTQLDKAYAEYVSETASSRGGPLEIALPVHSAMRGYNQAVEMLHIPQLRTALHKYAQHLTEFYLMFGQPRDDLDAARKVPTFQELNDEHLDLGGKLRDYEKT